MTFSVPSAVLMSAPTNRSGRGRSGGADRAVVTTDAPELLRRWTMASPMPLVPPVTSARLPLNSVSEEPLIPVPPSTFGRQPTGGSLPDSSPLGADGLPDSGDSESARGSRRGLLRSCHVFAFNRQRELEDSTVRHIRRCPEPPPVGLDNRAAYRQPHAHTLRLGCIEGVEEAVETTRI